MRVLVTGAGGFVGRALLRALAPNHEAIAFDRKLAGAAGIEGDLGDASQVALLLEGGFDTIVHLATVPGGAAEIDPAQAWQVNVTATRALLDAAARMPRPAHIVFASSIAVFGDPLPEPFGEDAPIAPTLLYGAHKAMMETWLATLERRGVLRGVALRLPGIVARPPAPAGLKSAFLSDLFHALRKGRAIDLPVSVDATTLLMSVESAAANLLHAVESGVSGCITLPALRVRMGDLVAAVARQVGAAEGLVSWRPDPSIEDRFGRMPELATPRARALGFAADPTLEALAGSALATLQE